MASGELVLVGITQFAQDQLGDIVSIELPRIGSKFRQMQAMAIIDSVKASSDIFSPVSGEVVEVNEDLIDHPEWINQSPYELGWIVKIRPSNIQEFDGLMTAEKYKEFIGENTETGQQQKKLDESHNNGRHDGSRTHV